MGADRIGRQPLARLAEQRVLLEPAACAGDARFRVDDDVVDVDQPGFRKRHQREQRRRRIAAGTGDQPRRGDLLPVKLGEAVHGFALQFERPVLMAVPLRIGVLVTQPEVGGHVEDFDLGVGFENRRDDLLCGAVRQPAEHRVETAPVDFFPFDELRQVEHEEMRKHVAHGLAGVGIGSERRDLGIRMPRQQAHRVSSSVAGRAENADLLLRSSSVPLTCQQAPASAACSAPLRPRHPCRDCRAARPAPPGDVFRWQRRKARACWSR